MVAVASAWCRVPGGAATFAPVKLLTK